MTTRDWHGVQRSYRRDDGAVAEALRALVPPGSPVELDRRGVLAAWGEIDDPLATVITGVRRAPCAEVAAEPRASGAWAATFEEAVARIARAASDPVVALGGGLDAAAVLVAWRASGVAMPRVATFAAGLAGYDETDEAVAAARGIGVPCEVIEAPSGELVARAPAAAVAAETPLYNLHPAHRLVLSREVQRRGGATLVTGDGADAVFAQRPDHDYVPIVVALGRAAGLATASPFFADDLIAATPHDLRKQHLRDYLRERRLGWLADRPKRPRLAPALDLAPILDHDRIARLGRRLGIPARLDADRERVGWATLDHLARASGGGLVTRVLVVTLPEKGHYHPLLGPAAELARRGAEVVFAATHDVADELREAGVARVVVPPGAPPPPAGARGEALARVLVDPPRLAGWIRSLLVEAPRRGVDALRSIVRDVRPDVVAIDTMAYDAAIAAELERVPWVGWATSLNPVVRDDTETQLLQTLRALDADRHALFAAYGLTARFRVSDVLSPRGTAVFATEALIDPSGGATLADVHLVGPSLGGTRGGEVVDPAFAEGRPIVYVSFGSQAWYQPRRFDRLFAAAATLDLAVLAAMGDLAADYRRRPPPRVRCVAFASQLDALAHAATIVTHGGANSVMEACAYGVPLLVAPICNDQPHNAAFVERAGCGLAVDLERCSDAELVGALRRLVDDGPIRARAREVRASYAGRSGARGGADLAERARQ